MSDEWISTKDNPPKETKKYIVTNGIEVEILWYFLDHEMFYDGDGVVVFVPRRDITHWMELPKLPKK